MTSLNKVMVIGNITANLVLKHTPDNQSVVNFAIAVNQNYKNKAGQKVDVATFIPVVVWGKQAESCSKYASKGSLVFIEGGLQNDIYTTKDGTKITTVRLLAQSVQFIKTAKADTNPAAPAVSNETIGGTNDEII